VGGVPRPPPNAPGVPQIFFWWFFDVVFGGGWTGGGFFRFFLYWGEFLVFNTFCLCPKNPTLGNQIPPPPPPRLWRFFPVFFFLGVWLGGWGTQNLRAPPRGQGCGFFFFLFTPFFGFWFGPQRFFSTFFFFFFNWLTNPPSGFYQKNSFFSGCVSPLIWSNCGSPPLSPPP